MVFLVLAIIASSLVSIMMRVGERQVKNNISMLSVNYIICMFLSIIYTNINNLFQNGNGIETAIGLGSINGFFYIASFVLFQNSVKQHGVVLSSIFMKLGIMVPLVISIVLFKEVPTLKQILGFLIAFVAIILINLREKNVETVQKHVKKTMQVKWGLCLVLLGCGMADGMSKIYQELGGKQFEELFLVLTFVIAFLLSVLLVIIKKQKITKNEIIYGSLLGVPNYFSARFLLKALGEISAVVAYPTFSIGTIAVITIIGIVAFKEKISKLHFFAVALIAIAVVLLN